MAQLASARLSEREVSGSIFSDFNVCFDFPLIRVAIAWNTRKTTLNKVTLPLPLSLHGYHFNSQLYHTDIHT